MGEPTYLVIIGSSSDKAEQLIEDIKAELEVNPRMIAHFGEQKQLGSWEGKFFVTKGGFIGQALGIGKNVRGLRVRGRRPTLLVIDDIETEELNNNPERQIRLAKWVEKSLIPTMDGPVRRLIYAHNRYAETMVQTILQERHPKWFVHDVPAYDPITYKPTWHQKYPDNYFRDLEDEIGIIAALSEYNNQPHVEGEIFKEEQIQWGDMPALNHFKIIVGHWDVAYAGTKTSDYNAVEIMGLKDKDFWHIDCFVKQCKMRDAIAFMCDVQKNLPKTVIIHWQFEAQFWNDEVERTIDEVQQEMGVLLLISKIPTPTGNKYDRILQLQPRYQNSRIYYNNKKKSHKDTQTGLAQLYATQPGNKKKDDWPDAQHQCIEFLQKYIPMGKASGNFQTGRMLPHNERI
ncbi:MAG: hypothetical protein K1X81_01930 [Bacteroidia bacterium]|nr:hypothetical protein [Bacteroidia bacterium]